MSAIRRTKKRSATRLHTPREKEGFLSAEAVDAYLLPKRKARAYNSSGEELGAEAVKRRFAELEQHFQRG